MVNAELLNELTIHGCHTELGKEVPCQVPCLPRRPSGKTCQVYRQTVTVIAILKQYLGGGGEGEEERREEELRRAYKL